MISRGPHKIDITPPSVAKGPEAQRVPMAHQGHLTEGCLYNERRTLAQSIGGFNPWLFLVPWKGRDMTEWHGGPYGHQEGKEESVTRCALQEHIPCGLPPLGPTFSFPPNKPIKP